MVMIVFCGIACLEKTFGGVLVPFDLKFVIWNFSAEAKKSL